jgi:hypothetical protein
MGPYDNNLYDPDGTQVKREIEEVPATIEKIIVRHRHFRRGVLDYSTTATITKEGVRLTSWGSNDLLPWADLDEWREKVGA